MTSRYAGWVGITLLVLFGLFLSSAPVLAEDSQFLGQNVSGSVDFGAAKVSGNTDSSKFNEYRDIKSGPFLDELNLDVSSKGGKRYFDLNVSDPGLTDQNYQADLGYYNLYEVTGEFDEIHHVLSNTATTPYHYQGDGVFTLDDSLKGRRGGGTGASGAGLGPIAACCTQGVDLSIDRKTGRFGFRYTPLPQWDFRLNFSSERQQGFRPMSWADSSSSNAVTEVMEPISYWTHNLTASAEYDRKNYNVKFAYQLSIFQNGIDSIIVDNHLLPGQAGTSGNIQSDRFQTSAYPDNVSHMFSLSGAIRLPAKSRFVGTASYSLLRQNEDLLPYTINPNTVVTQPVPRSTADARVNNSFLNFVLTNQAIKNLDLKASYRYSNRDNKTPIDQFYPVFADTGSAQSSNPTTDPTLPQRFREQTVELEGSWHLLRGATWNLGVGHETSDNPLSDFRYLRENRLKTSLNLIPSDWLQVRPSYLVSKRKAGSVSTTDPAYEPVFEGNRTRNQAGLDVNVTPSDVLSFSLGSTYLYDRYPDTDYGVQSSKGKTFSADVSYSPIDRLSLYANYSHEQYRTNMRRRRSTGGTNYIGTWPVRDYIDTVGVGANAVLIPQKLDAGVSWALSYARTFQSAGYDGVAPAPTNSAAASDWPTIRDKFTNLDASVRYKPRKNLTVKVRYTYDRYREDDFTQDYWQPDMHLITDPTSSSQYYKDALWLGATQPSYAAHIIAASLQIDF